MRWTRRQVEQVSALRAEAFVAAEVLARARLDVMHATRTRLARALVDAAHPFAVELHPDDLQFSEEDTGDFRGVRVRAAWAPQTHTAEFVGGHFDGRILEIPEVGHPLVTAPPEEFGWSEPDEPVAATPRRVVYDLAGWHETERRWIYEADR